MKAIKCEMCNSSDVVKQDGFFVCQSCGTKYSVEEAKKLMIEGTVDVQGTVKVDNSSFVEKYLQNARRAMAKEDWDEVEKYYNMVEQNDPSNIEAIFYSAYGKAIASLSSDDVYKREAIFKSLTKSVSIIDDNYNVDNEAELKGILTDITTDVIKIFGMSFVYTQKGDGSNNADMTYNMFVHLGEEMFTTLENIIAKFPREKHKDILYIYRLKLSVAELLSTTSCAHISMNIKWSGKAKIVADEISKFDPSIDVNIYEERKQKLIKKDTNTAIFGCLGVVAVVVLIIWIIFR
ncbi:MAG: TFIIB-type zinc finger domain-containing protein [Clostridia bacterium]|nr:TFIIB-type zinc finger domain-containing protein [Clostridia bacterium]